MRLEQQAPLHVAPDPCSLRTQDNNILCSLDLVDNNNSDTLAVVPNVQPVSANTNTTAAVLEAWARDLERSVSPCTPEEDDDEDDEGGGAGRSSSSAVSEAEEEEARSSCCPSACSSTSSEASELANLASTSSSSSVGGSGECSSEDEQPASPVPPFTNRHDEQARCSSFNDTAKATTQESREMSDSEDDKVQEPPVASVPVVKVAPTAPVAPVLPMVTKPEKPRSKSNKSKYSGTSTETLGAFDVFTMETALPKLDLAQLESHLLAAARSEDRRRRNDREEIRRRLAMGEETERPGGRKPSLQSRLQSGMNLQLCFMNETAPDFENLPNQDIPRPTPPVAVPITLPKSTSLDPEEMQREAQLALAQASQMAHMEMALERHQMRLTSTPSPTSQLLQRSLHKVGVAFPPERRRVSRQLLTDMNVTQLQVLVNDLHTLIEGLNEELVQLLMERDDLHMEQDSRLVDIEDLNRYLGAKSQPLPAGLHR